MRAACLCGAMIVRRRGILSSSIWSRSFGYVSVYKKGANNELCTTCVARLTMFTHSFFTMPPHAPQLPALLQIHRAGGPPGGALAKITTDSAFSRGPHVSPTHTEGELAAMTPVARARAVATDRANKEVRKSVESGYVKGRRERERVVFVVCVCVL